MLHHRIVDRVGWTRGKGVCVRANEVHVAAALCHGRAASLQHGGLQGLHGFDPLVRSYHEEAAVPQIVAAVHIGLRQLLVGLFLKTLDAEGSSPLDRMAFLNVAIAGFGAVSHDAECDHGPILRQGPSSFHGTMKVRRLGHHVVSGHSQQDGLLRGRQRRQCQRWRGITAHWF